MATSLNTAIQPRDSGYQSVHALRRSFVFGDFPTGALTKKVGGLPAYAQVVGGGIVVTTLVGAQTLNIGWLDYDETTADPDAYATALAVAAAGGFVVIDELAAATAQMRSVPTQVTVTASAALTAGAFDVIIFYVTKNPASGAAN